MLNLNEILREYEPLYHECRASNFNHVTRNLLAVADLADCMGKQAVVNESLDSLKKYFLLLDEFPQFKEVELAQGGGSILGSVEDYVNGCYERLKVRGK